MTSDGLNSDCDEALVERVRGGDGQALGELERRYRSSLLRFCAGYLRDEAPAEDVVQDVFADMTRAEGLPSGTVKPWLYKVARNRCLDILRRHQRSPTHHHRINTGFDAAKATAGPGTRAARNERREMIRAVVADMPEDYRSVLTLKYFEGFSREEIAETLGVTEAAVKGRLARASDYLREELRKITDTGS